MQKDVAKISDLDFEKQGGLIPAIIQDADNNQVLMLAYMSSGSLKLTLKGGKCTYFSRKKKGLWLKGETSGCYQHVVKIFYDCDCDTLLVLVKQDGVACHTGNRSCFYRELNISINE